MTDEISDAMTARRKRAADIRVKDSSRALEAAVYTNRRVAMTMFAIELAEKELRLLHCPACIIHHPLPNKHIELSFMYATFEPDPLKNFWKYVSLHCAHCDATEMLALDRPEYSTGNILRGGRLDAPEAPQDIYDPWVAVQHEMAEEEKLKFMNATSAANAQTAGAVLARQQMQQAMLGQMYGAAGNAAMGQMQNDMLKQLSRAQLEGVPFEQLEHMKREYIEAQRYADRMVHSPPMDIKIMPPGPATLVPSKGLLSKLIGPKK